MFDEIDVLLRFPTLLFGAILFIEENEVPLFYHACSKRLTVSFIRLNANLGRVSPSMQTSFLSNFLVHLDAGKLDEKVETRNCYCIHIRRVSPSTYDEFLVQDEFSVSNVNSAPIKCEVTRP